MITSENKAVLSDQCEVAETRPPVSATSNETALGSTLFRGIAWTSALRWFGQILSWIATLIMTRLLAPADYGLFGMATVYLGLVAIINEFSLGAAVVVKREMTEDQIAQLNTLALFFGM